MKSFISLFFVLLFGCSNSDETSIRESSPYAEGLTTHFITVNNITRKYLVYRPSGMTNINAVVTVLHGGGGLGVGVSELGAHPLSVFRTIADQEKFLVIYRFLLHKHQQFIFRLGYFFILVRIITCLRP